ncbi:SDR family NAD(P)-dependent oxidoreductase [Xenorhabdus bovienii]|uniref:SDR family NAD(P)-dependent oxidoreductase n=1 Tax=Xenorhabdus bovienii TaxID=40576 RepID=UPI0023B2243D|nr:SDR family NAD(P)-dependent oxidoreductase [Xenorhabdus bovienii]MDE9436112.1 SDR family NAD(P)-dependent oxidoreductase [Xenorhabdus bovienii]MDE9497921.1 SDR family NAD(P)-dependent oxidoreductase [Xenorhabdus bovienii]
MDIQHLLSRLKKGELSQEEAKHLLTQRDIQNKRIEHVSPDTKSAPSSSQWPDAVAVIGWAGQFPAADSVDIFWQQLLKGEHGICEVPSERWDSQRFFTSKENESHTDGKSRCKWGGFINDIATFDAGFFHISPHEADLMDPQARLFLQEAWHAFENAGYAPRELRGSRCGVYVGVMQNDYIYRLEQDERAFWPQVMQGNTDAILASRIAYHLDLKGPAVAFNTACSSSLVALHQACNALHNGDADMMLVGGVTLYVTEKPFILMSNAGMLSPTGRCHTFDHRADGIVPGEAVVAVVLKPLSHALRDNDHIHGAIRASGINQDGQTNGITAPNLNSQAELLKTVYHRGGIDPASIQFIETHGTGTPLGDPIEIEALNRVFEPYNLPTNSIVLGAVKANTGHTSAAAGLVSLIKTLKAINAGCIPPIVGLDEINPHIQLADTPFMLNKTLLEWPSSVHHAKRAAISAFGFSGTNAHIVVEGGPEHVPVAQSDAKEHHLFVLSAQQQEPLQAQVRQLRDYLMNAPLSCSVGNIAATLARGRAHFAYRLVFIADCQTQLLAKLNHYLSGQSSTSSLCHVKTINNNFDNDLITAWQNSRTETLPKVAQAWLSGVEIDWSLFYPRRQYRSCPLPGYTFVNRRHWTKASPAISSLSTTSSLTFSLPHRGLPENVTLYRTNWQPQVIPQYPSEQKNVSGLVVTLDRTQAELFLSQQPSLKANILVIDEQFQQLITHQGNDDEAVRNFWETRLPEVTIPSDIYFLAGHLSEQEQARTTVWFPVVSLVITILNRWRKQPWRLIYCYQQDHERAFIHHAVGAFARSVMHEYPQGHIKVVGYDRTYNFSTLPLLAEIAQEQPDAEVIYRQGQRYVKTMANCTGEEVSTPSVSCSLRQKGIYLITGGFGGIGQHLARYLLTEYQATVILTGRRKLSENEREKLSVLSSSSSGQIIYLQCDYVNQQDVQRSIAFIEKEYGTLNGIFYAAGTLRDGYLVRKSLQDVLTVCQPKVEGLEHLHQATRHIPLECFVLMSSVAGAIGNLGQSDYSLANAFQDGFAGWRNAQLQKGKARGNTLSIQWPLWAEGGMQIDAEERAYLTQLTGMVPLPTDVAMAVLETLLERDKTGSIMPFYGDNTLWQQRLQAENLLSLPVSAHSENRLPLPSEEASRVFTDSTDFISGIRQIVALCCGMATADIDTERNIQEYGFDSLLLKRLSRQLANQFGSLPEGILFEHNTIHKLAGYLARRQGDNVNVTEQKRQHPVSEQQPAFNGANVASSHDERDIAIIGISARYPSAASPEALWQLLCHGNDPVGIWPAQQRGSEADGEWLGYYLDNIDEFDPHFFGLSQRDASMIDPQERLLMEAFWLALENAGYTGDRLEQLKAADGRRRNVGVFAAVTSSHYQLLAAQRWPAIAEAMPAGHYWTLANRLSHWLDFAGPSMPIDTACSSSLTALALACDALRQKQCRVAVVGGVNLYLHPSRFTLLQQSGLLSPDGRCHSFAEHGQGFGPGEGVAAVVLKPLAQAKTEGDQIYGVIKGYSVGHGGSANSFTAPNPTGQARVIRQALEDAGVSSTTLSYIEAHGTGTELGDPVELYALQNAWRQDGGQSEQHCALASVKANLGHGESVAGLTGLLRILLQFQHRQLAPHLLRNPVNPALKFVGTPFRLNEQLTDWVTPPACGKRRAGISAFGAGGVNAHIILEEPPQITIPSDGMEGSENLILLSAPSEYQLKQQITALIEWLDEHNGKGTCPPLKDVAYTLQSGRKHFDFRFIASVIDTSSLKKTINDYLSGLPDETRFQTNDVKINHASRQIFNDDVSTHEFIASLAKRRDWFKLGILWLNGVSIDWDTLRSPQRICALPGTIFMHRRCWFDDATTDKSLPISKQIVPSPLPPALNQAPMTVETPADTESYTSLGQENTEELQSRLWDEIKTLLPNDIDVMPEATLLDLGMDSINAMRLKHLLEQKFRITLTMRELMSELSLGEICQRGI